MQQIVVLKPRFEKQAEALEHTSFKQIQHDYTDGRNGRCAVGILLEYKIDQELPVEIRAQMVLLNDIYNLSFGEIAEWLRAQ